MWIWKMVEISFWWHLSWQPTPVFLPGESLGERSLVSYSPRGHKELGTTEPLHFHTFMALVVISPPSFLVFPWVLSLFFLGNLIKGLSILFIFSKNQLIVSLIFSIFFGGGGTLFYLFPFWSLLFLSFCWLWGFVCSSLSIPLDGRWGCIRDFPCFLRKACTAISFPLKRCFCNILKIW